MRVPGSTMATNVAVVRLFCRTLEAVTPPAVAHFRHLAEKLVAEKDVVELLSAALAVVSGNADIKQRSLLSSRAVLKTCTTRLNAFARS